MYSSNRETALMASGRRKLRPATFTGQRFSSSPRWIAAFKRLSKFSTSARFFTISLRLHCEDALRFLYWSIWPDHVLMRSTIALSSSTTWALCGAGLGVATRVAECFNATIIAMATATQTGQNFPLRRHRRPGEIALPQCGQNCASGLTGARQFGQISEFALRTCVPVTIPPVNFDKSSTVCPEDQL